MVWHIHFLLLFWLREPRGKYDLSSPIHANHSYVRICLSNDCNYDSSSFTHSRPFINSSKIFFHFGASKLHLRNYYHLTRRIPQNKNYTNLLLSLDQKFSRPCLPTTLNSLLAIHRIDRDTFHFTDSHSSASSVLLTFGDKTRVNGET